MIKVKLNKYDLDISDDKDAQEYERIRETCKASGFELFDVSLEGGDKFDSFPCEQVIDETHLFENQFNTVEGFRIFQWYESTNRYGRNINRVKRGYYLTGDLEELKKAQDNQLICSFCGKRYSALEARASGLVFCNACLGSENLVESGLNSLRLKALSAKRDRQELSESEKNEILPLFHRAQRRAHKERLAKTLEAEKNRLMKELDSQLEQMKELESLKPQMQEIESLQLQSDFFSKLLDFGVYEKPIYYSHTNKFVFNWQERMADSEIIELQKKLINFPFEYSIKGADSV